MNQQKSRKLFFLRHGERIDYTFGEWIPRCFDESGNYFQTDLNMPETVLKRPPTTFLDDTPLTTMGIFQATITGQAFKKTNLEITHVYCSPALRCIETCDAFLKGYGKKDQLKIKIEPGLYEWMKIYPAGLPDMLTPKEYTEVGYNIDLDYTPYFALKELTVLEKTSEQYYTRCNFTSNKLINDWECGNTLIVAHAGNFEGWVRKLSGKKQRPYEEAKGIITKIPYCYFLQMNETKDKWEVEEKPFLKLNHTGNITEFSQEMLTN